VLPEKNPGGFLKRRLIGSIDDLDDLENRKAALPGFEPQILQPIP
jgi:hypothetical protein